MLAKNNRRASLAGWWQPLLASCQSWSLILILLCSSLSWQRATFLDAWRYQKYQKDRSNKLLNNQLGIYFYHQAPQSLQKSPPNFLMLLPIWGTSAPHYRSCSLWRLIILLALGGYFGGPILSFFETQPSWVAVAWRVPAECCRTVPRLWGLCWTAGRYVGMTSWSRLMISFQKRKVENMKNGWHAGKPTLRLFGRDEVVAVEVVIPWAKPRRQEAPINCFVVESSRLSFHLILSFLAKKKNVRPLKW